MNSPLRKPARQYAVTLRSYVAAEQEALRQQAYELGREAIGRGLGVLDIARIHQQALASCLPSGARTRETNGSLKAAETSLSSDLARSGRWTGSWSTSIAK